MCRNIKTLYNFDPFATQEETFKASLQYIRKITGLQKPNLANELAFNNAVISINKTTVNLLKNLKTSAKKRNRDSETEKAKIKNMKRFSSMN